MIVIITIWPGAAVQIWATLLTRLAEQYPDATITIDDPHHLRLIGQREWNFKSDKEFFAQLHSEDIIANWNALNAPYPGLE